MRLTNVNYFALNPEWPSKVVRNKGFGFDSSTTFKNLICELRS